MIKFLFKGLIRDRQRSLLPIMVVAIGVFLTVLFHTWVNGIMGDSIEFNAKFSAGHVKVVTKDYSENIAQSPNDAALMGVDSILDVISAQYPDVTWVERVKFGGLLDAPDENGETKAQGPAIGFGIDILSKNSEELERMNILPSIKQGKLPEKPGEVLISDQLLSRLKSEIGDPITLIGSTMNNDFAMYNFTIAGTVEFGTEAVDRGAIVADITDIRMALDMEGATGEILGFFESGYYDIEIADAMKSEFNEAWTIEDDEYSPTMLTLADQDNMAMLIEYSGVMSVLIITIFIFAMSLVLWNAGLLQGLRRYGEYGLRLAIGEEKNHVFKTMIYESLMVGVLGTMLGMAISLPLAYYLQVHGFDASQYMDNATIMMPSTFRARITPEAWYIGFIPGVFSTLLGTVLSSRGMFKRQTAHLFKELES